MDRSSPWDAGSAKQAETTREEQRKALTALTIRTLGDGIRDMIGSDRMSDEYWAEALQILARMVGGLPLEVKARFARALGEAMIKETVAESPDLAGEADAVRELLRQRREGRRRDG
jgi:hypothetical protein